MSVSRLVVPRLTEDELVSVNLLRERLVDLTPRNEEKSLYYDAKKVIRQVGTTIPDQYQSLGLTLGWAGKAVDGLARRCNLERMVWADGDIDSLGMRELADSNFLYSELSQGRTDSLLHGISYLITTKGAAGEPKALVHAKSALDGTGTWNARSRRLDDFLSVNSRENNEITGFTFYMRRPGSESGVLITATRENGKWKVDKSDNPWGVPVEPLVYRPRTSKRMGRSRISRPVRKIQDSAVRSLIRLEAHMDIYTIPKMIMLGADSSIFQNPDGTPTTAFDIVMGRWFGIPDDDDAANPRADVEQFSAESPAPHLAGLNAYAKMMARETDLPDSDFALTDMANPTSEGAYDSGRDNLYSEAEGAQEDWSVSTRRTVARALAMQNGMSSVPAEFASIDTQWRDVAHVSRSSAADAGSKIIGAVPALAGTRVGLRKLGLSEQDIDLALAEMKANVGRQSAAAIIAARTADQGVADGVSAGVEGATGAVG